MPVIGTETKFRNVETLKLEDDYLEPRAYTTAPFPRAGSAQVVRVCTRVRV